MAGGEACNRRQMDGKARRLEMMVMEVMDGAESSFGMETASRNCLRAI